MQPQSRRALIALLLAAFLVADAATLIAGGSNKFPEPVAVLHFALGFSQLSLLAIWAALGSLHFVLRLPVVVATAVALTLYVHDSDFLEWAVLVAVLMAVVVVPLGMVRWRTGLRLDAGTTEASLLADRRPVQFSLRNLMLSVTFIAVVLGVLRALAPFIEFPGFGVAWEVFIIGSGLAIVGLAAAWFGLGTGRWLLKCLTLLVVTGAVGWLIANVSGPPWPVVLLVAVQTMLLAGSLAVLRLAGYRLTRRSGARGPFADALPSTDHTPATSPETALP